MPTRPLATSIVKKLQESGHIAYFAGGWVRDYLMKHPSDDIDIATSASVEEIQTLFSKTIPLGLSFGIVVVVEGGHSFEVATFRKEKEYVDGRRPTRIEPATAEEDAQRRDFTINGMFFDPIKEKLYDYVEGQKDLKEKIIRAIGDPHERFSEDRLRMMRAVRYSTRFNFTIEPNTLQAILFHAPALFPSVAIERVWQEFVKMSRFAPFNQSLEMLHALGLLPTIFPELKFLSCQDIQERLKYLSAFRTDSPLIAQLLELFPDHSQEQTQDLCEYLKLSKEQHQIALFLQHAKTLLNMPQQWLSQLELSEWAHFYAHPFASLSLDIYAAHLSLEDRLVFLNTHQKRCRSLEKSIVRIQNKNPVIRAEDLIKEGITPGKHLGELLKIAERFSINSECENKEEIIRFLKNSSMWNN